MLDPWIIEQIRRREREAREGQRPSLELPLSDSPEHWPPGEEPVTGDSDHGTERGVTIISI